ncbi:MAG TPA: DUF4263 domain-containing protein [Clostridiales bacterium]|jgi:hypothetical protein|nr:DUF4263 domain-containing protein [Clostridiales bacterium]
MKPSGLYKRDYNILTLDEKKLKKEYLQRKSETSLSVRKAMKIPSVAVRHNISLFPNNHIELNGIKEETDIAKLNAAFLQLISKEGCPEQEVLNFINNTPAYHIVASILIDRFPFGHHDLYLFKEMGLGIEYRTDYVLIGKGSGGYEFVLVEFEKPDGRITLQDGHLGEAFRKGLFQAEDWKAWMDANFDIFAKDLASVKGNSELPLELTKYDSTRFHYVVVAGRRDNFSETTYRTVREKRQRLDIHLLHHDNLYDSSVKLETAATF